MHSWYLGGMRSTGVELGDAGAVIVKRAIGAGSAVEALRREGERLARAAHPGVVGVVRSGPTPDGWELLLAHGGRPLSAHGALTPRAVATIAASIAATVADLHDLGVVHGRLDTSHVLVGDQGRPMLCGFGDGTAPAEPADDVAAIGRLLGDLLGTDAEPEVIPERRWWPKSPRGGWERKALLAVADVAVAEPPERRPSARRLAAALVQAVPGGLAPPPARSPAPAHLEADPIERLRPVDADAEVRRGSPVGLVVVAVVGLAVVLAGARIRSSSLAATSPPPTVAEPAVVTEITATATPVPGSVLVSDGRRYRVGQAGDHLLVDDWWCDGQPTPALLRPSTDEVFVFESWSTARPQAIPPTTSVPGATALVSRQDGDGCPSLAAAVGSGDLVPIDLGGTP